MLHLERIKINTALPNEPSWDFKKLRTSAEPAVTRDADCAEKRLRAEGDFVVIVSELVKQLILIDRDRQRAHAPHAAFQEPPRETR